MDRIASIAEVGSGAELDSGGPRPRIVISANSFWNIKNFREKLVDTLTAQGYRVVVAAPQPDHGWAREKGVQFASLSIDRSGLNPLVDGRLFLEYIRLFKRNDADFYLAFTVKPNIYGTFAARLCGVAAIPNVSGLGTAFISEGPLSRLVSHLYRIAFRKCPIIFFQNPDDRDLFLQRKIVRPEQVRLLPGSGVDLDRFAPPIRESSGASFLFIGRLLGDKGVRELVEAARLLRAKRPDWKFQLLGSTDPGNRSTIGEEELNRWVEEGAIEYLGTTDDVRPFIAASTAVVLPSYREGLPRTLLEAASMARPLIATDVPGNRQIVQHGVNGLLCALRDAKALADAMLAMGDMPLAERQSMGRASRQLVENNFGEERVISAYLEAIAQLRARGGV